MYLEGKKTRLLISPYCGLRLIRTAEDFYNKPRRVGDPRAPELQEVKLFPSSVELLPGSSLPV